MKFCKYHGAGNDFILVDNRELCFPVADAKLIHYLCHRHMGIGADGLILLQKGDLADGKMRIFNADGSEAAMCGNGIRCLFHFGQSLGFFQERAEIETQAGILSCSSQGSHVSVLLPSPSFTPDLEVVDTGVPHAVIFVEDLAAVDVEKRGREVRFHPRFSPSGVNATFAQILPEQKSVKIRTYERGVEKETLACGTGALAAAFVAIQKFSLTPPLNVLPPSNEILEIDFSKKGMELKGPASLIFTGDIII
jgi:diaminopimelate epimerase